MKWGTKNEESGIKGFEKRMGGQVTKCGLHVSRNYPHIGKYYLTNVLKIFFTNL